MQFGLVLTFATLALASPTPAMLEDRQTVSGSGGASVIGSGITLPSVLPNGNLQLNPTITSAIDSLNSNLGGAFQTSAGNLNQLLTSASSSLTGVTKQVADDILAGAKSLRTSLTQFETSTYKTFNDALQSTTTTVGTIARNDFQSLSNSLNALTKTVTTANLGSIATLTVAGAIKGLDNTVTDELKRINDLLAPVLALAAPLKSLSATVASDLTLNTTPLTDVVNGVSNFVSSVAPLVLQSQ